MSFRFHAAAQQVVLVQVKVENRDQASFPLPVHLSLSLLSCFILSDPSMPPSRPPANSSPEQPKAANAPLVS